MTKGALIMPIASLKAKVISISQNGSDNDSSVTNKLGAISSRFKYMPTIIAQDLKIEGDISSLGLIEIEGSIKGNLKGNSVVLREEGFFEGTVIAQSLSIRGTFEGNIRAKNITITSKAKVSGNIEYESLCVEDGACIDGQFKNLINNPS
jgi:cytoskeletal protein CcmA (bactofilin family)